MSDDLLGKVIDKRYRVDRQIGEGGMGVVFQGEHVSVGNKVAIKVLHPEYSKDEEVVRRLAQEARVAGTLGHKNIVQVFDFSQTDEGTHYLVMEFLEGETLADYLAREGPVSPRFIVPVALQVLDALGAAHARGIIHRDLKPENVFLTTGTDPTAHVKVLDFGISKIRTGGDDLHLTKTGTVLGTPYFMSPEQASGKKDIDARTDIYALGVILYQALTGSYPFTGDTYNELIINIFSNEAPLPRELRPDLPEAVEQVILKAMAKQREERFANARQCSEALSSLLADPALKEHFGGLSRSALMRSAQRTALASAPPPPPEGVQRTGRDRQVSGIGSTTGLAPARSRAPMWIAVALAAVAAAAAVWYVFLRGEPGSGTTDAGPAAGDTSAVAVNVSADAAVGDAADGGADEAAADEGGSAEAAAEPETVAVEAGSAGPDVAALPPTEVVMLKITTRPADAEIRIDGATVTNPYDGRFRRGGPDVKVEITARGFDPVVQLVSLTEDHALDLELQRRTNTPRRDGGVAAPADTGTPPPPPPPPADSGRPGIDQNNPFTRRDGGAAAIDRSRPFP
jgi:serine/threonine-protein kinase